MQLRDALRAALASLEDQNIPSPGLAAELLFMHVLGCDRSYLYTHPELDLPPQAEGRYFDLIAERSTGKPTQYITGHQEFWGLDFEVTPDVLIPRPETEHLVETVMKLAQSHPSRRDESEPLAGRQGSHDGRLRIVDVGTGSGCIALALASELPQAEVFATDVSRPALQVARRNAARLGLAGRVCLLETDLLTGISPQSGFEFVVSNPPYVGAEIDRVQREVRDFEPRIALGGAGSGVEIYRRLFPQALAVLRPGGYVVVEIGYSQAESVMGSLGTGWTSASVQPDLAGIPRVVMARKEG